MHSSIKTTAIYIPITKNGWDNIIVGCRFVMVLSNEPIPVPSTA